MAKKKPITNLFTRASLWEEELEILFQIVRNTELEETTKWGGPCFVINGKMVLGIGGFKSYVGIWFYQGVFLKDKYKVLVTASEGITKALRQWRFQSKSEIDVKKVKAYVLEAIQNAKDGKELKPEKKKSLVVPIELVNALKADKKLNDNFKALSPFKQREYAEFIESAKREETKLARIKKSIPLIILGKGLNDKYR
jgi:uncharacterized protein YdeI (YjbR/CyaY-like superfamily)